MSEANSNDLDARIAGFDPTDPASLAALESELAGGGEATTQPAEPQPAEVVAGEVTDEPAKQDEKKAEQVAEPAAVAKPEGAPSGVQEPKGVQAKDGEHIIPYSVLERERERASRAEATVTALAQQLEQLQAGKAPTEAAGAALSKEDLDQLDQDLPGVAKVIRAQMAAIDQLTGTVQTLQREQEIDAQTRQRSAQDETEAAIAANPDLTAWRAAANRAENPDPLMFNRAADLDAVLREDPAWKDKPIADRFAKVSETIKALYGQPAAPQPSPTPQPTPADLKQAAEAKMKETQAAVPTTLSDIPGGNPPAQSHIESLENASAVALGNRFLTMTPDQLESELARFGI